MLKLVPQEKGKHVEIAREVAPCLAGGAQCECKEVWVRQVLPAGATRRLPIRVYVAEECPACPNAIKFFTLLGICSDWPVEIRNVDYTGDDVTDVPTIDVAGEARISGFPIHWDKAAIIKFVKPVISKAYIVTSPYFEELAERLNEYMNRHGLILNPDIMKRLAILERLIINRERTGKFLCPCKRNVECPCPTAAAEARRMGHCTCGLLVPAKHPPPVIDDQLLKAASVLVKASKERDPRMKIGLVREALSIIEEWLRRGSGGAASRQQRQPSTPHAK